MTEILLLRSFSTMDSKLGNESVKFGFTIDFKILMDRISKFRPDHDMALVDIVYHCCFRSVRWRARYIAMNRSKSRSKIDF